MPVTVYNVLDQLRDSALSKTEQGTRFERLMKAFLTTDPVYADQFSQVWLWSEWPGNGGKHDTGIDLIAQDRITGGAVAIQCKFYAPTSTISKDDIDTFLSESGKEGFVERIVVSTTDKWNAHAENAVKNQQISVRRIGMSDLEASPVDWAQFSIETPEVLVTRGRKSPRPHQVNAIEAATAKFAEHDRGKMIMACGTGKTFTSLRLAEKLVGRGGSVLFLVPSISLLSQTLREWAVEAEVPLHPLAVCSDRKSTKRSANADSEDIATVDLALPATTNVPVLAERLRKAEADVSSMTVVFSTYQSIDVVAKAQREAGVEPFNLIVCDEAHRTTGVTLADDDDESPFVRVHDDAYIQGAKRLYMTATPRIYDDATKAKAGEAAAVLASMDNEEMFGPEFYRLGFGDAVSMGLLTDYKVLVLAVDSKTVATTFQTQLANPNGELQLDDVAKIVGCWNGLAKKGHAEHSFEADPEPMRRAVAFAGTIKASKTIEGMFSHLVDQYVAVHETDDEGEQLNALDCEVRHVDGTFNALERNTRLDWLRAEVPDGQCRILTNARCLSEGVDVPALDSVMFMAPRKSVVDVVQSVGRVMRLAPGKKFGYIILPIAIPEGIEPEVALRDNARYQVVWEVLQALRAHDDRFNAEVNKIDLTKRRSDRINVIGVGGGGRGTGPGQQLSLPFNFAQLDEWRDAIYSRIVKKVGTRRYWEDWAADVARIAENHITRITALLDSNHGEVSAAFSAFLNGLRANLNEGITRSDAIEMLAQHLITRPVFDALFRGYAFTEHNPVAQIMEEMLATLDEQSLDTENSSLAGFYDSVRKYVEGVDTAEGRQAIITKLYENFFSTAFRRTVDKLGIVYTPVEIVDFILKSADDVLREEFGQGLTDENVHILDGFTGTGTFIVRLIQSGLIAAADLPRKYVRELHANEILLLAYYIAAVNIESAYHDRVSDDSERGYEPFPGLVLTDTFQSYEDGDRPDFKVFRDNNARLAHQKSLPITVIVGNPPYSTGQNSANDNNANDSYPTLDEAIRSTYVAKSKSASVRSIYDSYIRAIKWATLRLRGRGVIAFVTNGGFIDTNSADGLRKTLAEEFTSIHIFNLLGNMREVDWQRQGGQIFGAGSQATVAITVLVKNAAEPSGLATIKYTEVGDHLTREEKLAKVAAASSILKLDSRAISPNREGDWINQRRKDFGTFVDISSIFDMTTNGVVTNRDAWVYSFNKAQLIENVERLTQTFEQSLGGERVSDSSLINWSRSLQARHKSNSRLPPVSSGNVREVQYRPFARRFLYYEAALNEVQYKTKQVFPTRSLGNIGFVLPGTSSHSPFCVMMTSRLPDLHLIDTGSLFARFRYEPAKEEGTLSFEIEGEIVDGYRKIDNITDQALARFRAAYGDEFTKDDIFFYVYGLLHSPEYRETYSADLKRMLPRLPLVSNPRPFAAAGRALSDLHLGYEQVEPYPLGGLNVKPAGDPYSFFRVEKMAFRRRRVEGKLTPDKSAIVYNSQITLTDIPEDAYRYKLGARSAIEWIIDRYVVKTDKPSGIVNDPNDWSREVGDPRYIVDLLARIVTVSVETVRIVDALPPLDIRAASDAADTN